MSTNVDKLLNQYAERIVQLERQVAELQDELEQYEGSAEDLAEQVEDSADDCDCPACSVRRDFPAFMRSIGIPVEDDEPEEEEPRGEGMAPSSLLDMLLGASKKAVEVKAEVIFPDAPENCTFADLPEAVRKKLLEKGVDPENVVIRNGK